MAAVGICRSCDQRNVAACSGGKTGRVLRRVLRARLFRYRAIEEDFGRGEEAWTHAANACRSTHQFRRRETGRGIERDNGGPFGTNGRGGYRGDAIGRSAARSVARVRL